MTEVATTVLEPARDLLSRAQDNTYRWPADFAGFHAALLLVCDGRSLHGTVEVAPGAQVFVELPGVEEDHTEWVHQQLSSVAMHRQPVPSGEGELRHVISYVDDPEQAEHPLGVKVAVADPLCSSYRIRDGRISEITRHPQTVTIRVQIQHRTETADGRFVPSHLVSTLSDPQTGQIRQVEVLDEEWTRLGDLVLPARRTVSTHTADGVTVRSIELSGHALR